MKTLNTEIFILKAKSVHGDMYDYTSTEYYGCNSKIKIGCKVHGEFTQLSRHHLRGHGCPKCGLKERLTTDDFVKRAIAKHGKLYNYDKCNYTNQYNDSKVDIICHKHGVFSQRPADHLKGSGCPKCGGTAKSTKGDFIKKSKLKHGNRYNYSETHYINDREKISIICPKHGLFRQRPNDHLRGAGCPKCGGTGKLTTEDFIERSKLIHGERYDYKDVVYERAHGKVKIGCYEHGPFLQKAYVHMNGSGCPMCKESKGERSIRNFLVKHKAKFQSQYRFDECRNVLPLPFDFMIKNKDGLFLVEYQGEQHFRPVGFGGDPEENFKKIKENDQIKKDFCDLNGYKLIEVPFNKLNELNQHLSFLL